MIIKIAVLINMPLITCLIKFTSKRFYLARDTPINNTVLSHYLAKACRATIPRRTKARRGTGLMSANVTRRFRTRTEWRMFARSRFVINLAHWSHSAVNPSTKIAATATTRPATWSGRAARRSAAQRLVSLVRRTRFGAFIPGMRVYVGRGEPPPRNLTDPYE